MKKILLLLLLTKLILSANNLEIIDPYARATPPNMKNSAVFMTLKNSTKEDKTIVKASSNVAKFVELHTHDMKNGVMTMYEIPEIKVLANQTTVLKPGGLHIMLIELNKALNIDDSIELNLEFDDGTTQSLIVPVKSVAMGMKHHH